jgi:Flp pilus assembly protein TadG
MKHKRQSGQILVLFAGGLVGILALAALAIDLSSVFSLQQMERSAADAAALAGAQDLQTPGSRAVGPSDYDNARTHALANLASKLGATSAPSGPSCAPTFVVDCPIPGTPYEVSIKTPSPSAVNVDATRAVQVTVRQRDVPLTFARVFGQHDWNVAETSVAGLDYSGQYAIITLRPPVSGRAGNGFTSPFIGVSRADVTVNGAGSAVVAVGGDIGMNTGAKLNGLTATVSVADGYYIRYYGCADCTDHGTPLWPNAYKQLRALIQDPKYPVPVQGSTPPGGVDTSTCAAATATANASGYDTTSLSTITCYLPGVYASEVTVGPNELAILEPGVYFLNGGLTLKGSLIGGYEPASPGVALVFPQSQSFTINATAPVLALNRGSAYDLTLATGQPATAALFNGAPVQTNTTPPILMSVIVQGTPSCTVTIPAPDCADQTIKWAGAGGHTTMAVGGVVYAPSDNSQVAGKDDSVHGYFGQIVSWTIEYSGGSTVNENYPGGPTNGFVRLDTACSGGTTPCSP